MQNSAADQRRYYNNDEENNSDEFEGDNGNFKYNERRGYMNESEEFENYETDNYFNPSFRNNRGQRPGTGQIARYDSSKQRDYNFNQSSNSSRMKNNAFDIPVSNKPKSNFNAMNRANNISGNISFKPKKTIQRQQSFDNRTLRGNQFVNEPNRPTNTFDETPIRPLKHNPFVDDDRFQKQIKPRRSNTQKENFQKKIKKATSFDINLNDDDDDDVVENIEPAKLIQNRLLPTKYIDRNQRAFDSSHRRLRENNEIYEDDSIQMNQLVVAKSKSPIIFSPESSQIQIFHPPKMSKALVLVNPSEIPFSVRSLTERSFESNIVMMKTPRLNIKCAVESHSSPRMKTLIEMTQDEVNFEILRHTSSPTRSIIQYYYNN